MDDQCIFHAESKYGNENLNFEKSWHFLKNRLQSAPAWSGLTKLGPWLFCWDDKCFKSHLKVDRHNLCIVGRSKFMWLSQEPCTKTMLVCTDFNAFTMLNPSMAMKIKIVKIFEKSFKNSIIWSGLTNLGPWLFCWDHKCIMLHLKVNRHIHCWTIKIHVAWSQEPLHQN